MVRLREIKAAITALLKAKFSYKVHFDNVEKAAESYFYVEMIPRQKTIDRVLYARLIDVDIQLVLKPDENGRVKRVELYDAIDLLDSNFRAVFNVGDRFITVLNASSTIFDEVLHYRFTLEFDDCLEYEDDHVLPEELYLTIKKE